jgi:hypothetical protein
MLSVESYGAGVRQLNDDGCIYLVSHACMDVTEFISRSPRCILDPRRLVQLFVYNPILATLVAHPIPSTHPMCRTFAMPLEVGAHLLTIVAWCNSPSVSLASLRTSRLPNFLYPL